MRPQVVIVTDRFDTHLLARDRCVRAALRRPDWPGRASYEILTFHWLL